MQPPAVRDLNQVINTIGQSVQPLKSQYDADIAANETAGAAQVAGLDAKKLRAFKDIDQGAVDKGMQFGGFGLDSQARYTADTYLPALAQLQQTIATTRSGLMKEKLGLDRDVFNKSFDVVEQDRAVLNDWNKMSAQQQFEASEADKQRVFTAKQNEQQRAFQASEGAADRATSAANSARSAAASGGSNIDVKSVVGGVGSFLDSKKGKDNHVSPSTWQAAKQQWVSSGGDPGSFAQTFYGYANTSRDDLAAQYGL